MGKSKDRQLRTVLDALTDEEVASVLDFAQFLRDRRPALPETPPEIVDIPLPQDESVIAAIRRLTQTYPMLDRDTVFNEASGLMARHVMHGETREDTIDQLEALFQSRYASLHETTAPDMTES